MKTDSRKIFVVNLDCGDPEEPQFQAYLKEHGIEISPDPFQQVQESYDFSSPSREALEEMINTYWIDQSQGAHWIKEEQEMLFGDIEERSL